MSKFSRWLKWGAAALFIGWLFFSLSAYYVVQKPFSGPKLALLAETAVTWQQYTFSAAAVGRSLLDVAAALWIVWFALGTGLWLLNRFSLDIESNLEHLLFGLGLGLGGLGLLVLFFGLVGWLETAVFYAIAIILTLLTSKQSFSLLRRMQWPRPSRLVAIYLFLAMGLAFTLALLPPTSFDALLYHLEGPKLYLKTGQIRAFDNFPLFFPSLFEMFYMMAMALRGDITAKLLHFVFHLLLAGLVYNTAQTKLRLKDSWTAVLFLYAMPMILTLAGWAYSDLGLAFYQMAALVALLNWKRTRQKNWLILSGILCGLAMGFKYTSFLAPLTLAGMVVWKRRRDWKTAVSSLFQLAIPTTLVAAPMYIRNWLLVGNPVYPFLSGVFDGRYWDVYRTAAYAKSGTGIGLDPLALLRLPYDVTLGYKDVTQDVQIGPLLLAFLPLLLIYGISRWRKRAPAAFSDLLLFALIQFAFWTIGVISTKGLWQSRLLLSGFVVLMPALAWILQDLKRFDHPQFSLHRFINLVIGLTLALNLVGQITDWLPSAPWTIIAGTNGRDTYLRQTLGAHYAAMQAINQLPSDAAVVFLYEPRLYYCDQTCLPDSNLDKWGHAIFLYGSADAIAAAWQAEGITHVLLHQAGLDFMIEARKNSDEPVNTAVLQDLQTRHLQPVADIVGAYILYALQP